MSKYSKKSSSGGGHPYWNLTNWINGTLCYWRGNNQYSPETRAKLEARLQEMIDSNKNLAAFSRPQAKSNNQRALA